MTGETRCWASIEHRERLEEEARRQEAESGAYIRPICVIQVERTGKQQRKPGYVHTDDVREYLLQHAGISQEHIAVKTSAKDELKEIDDHRRPDVPQMLNPVHHY